MTSASGRIIPRNQMSADCRTSPLSCPLRDQRFTRNVLLIHFLIIGAIGKEQLLIRFQERRSLREPGIPYQGNPSARSQDPPELRLGGITVKPMKSLGAHDMIHRLIRQSVTSAEPETIRKPGSPPRSDSAPSRIA